MKKILCGLMFVVLVLSSSVCFANIENSTTLLNAVTSTGASSAVNVPMYKNKTFHIIASSVSTGGTVKIQSSLDGTNWADLASVSVGSNGTTEVAVINMTHAKIRANVTARTDGTYTVKMVYGK